MLVGYARTSTAEQVAGLEAQIRDLKEGGCEKIFVEQLSSVDAKRPQLIAAIDFVREGDTFVVTKLDRLARSVSDVLALSSEIAGKQANLRILNLGLDTSTPTGKLILTVMGGIAQFEREIMLERQREGIAKAKADGKYKGRKPTAMMRKSEVISMHEQGLGASVIAQTLGIGRRSVYRILGHEKVFAPAEMQAPCAVAWNAWKEGLEG